MEQPGLDLATGLIAEVVEWLQSGSLLSGTFALDSDGVIYSRNDRDIHARIADAAEYLAAIDANRDETPYLDLQGLLLHVKQCYQGVRSWDRDPEMDALVRSGNSIMTEIVRTSPAVERLAQQLHEVDRDRGSLDDLRSQIVSTIWEHFESLTMARALTLSRRYAPAEAAFAAYQQGLYPWGWDRGQRVLLCLAPDRV